MRSGVQSIERCAAYKIIAFRAHILPKLKNGDTLLIDKTKKASAIKFLTMTGAQNEIFCQ